MVLVRIEIEAVRGYGLKHFPPVEQIDTFAVLTMEEGSFHFMKRNMELFGFGSEEEALRTTFIELFDNSMDALLANSNLPPSSKEINIKLSQQTDGLYCIDITDNGIGMPGNTIPSLCGGIFQTSKQESQEQSVGKFGVGLKAIMMYYNTTLTVSSSILLETEITSYKVGYLFSF